MGRAAEMTMAGEPFLWPKLRELLRTRGELPLQHEVMTPGEIANAVQQTSGDRRVQRFVWAYYYPHRYGAEPGELSDDETAALIDSYTARVAVKPEASAKTVVPDEERCGICHHRPVRHTE